MEKIKKQIIDMIQEWDNADIRDFISEMVYLRRFHDLKEDLPFLYQIYNIAR